MRTLTLVYAVAACAATALPFAGADTAFAYCRGCVIETPKAGSAELPALTARAEAATPYTIEVTCHFERQKNGTRWRRVRICE